MYVLESREDLTTRRSECCWPDYAGGMKDLLLAQAERPDPSVWVGPGLLCLAILVAIALAMVLLWKNMNKQIGKIDFDEDGGGAPNGGEPHSQPH